MVLGLKPWTIFPNQSISGVRLASEYISKIYEINLFSQNLALSKVFLNTGFLWPVFSHIRTKSTILPFAHCSLTATEKIFEDNIGKALSNLTVCKPPNIIFGDLKDIFVGMIQGNSYNDVSYSATQKWSFQIKLFLITPPFTYFELTGIYQTALPKVSQCHLTSPTIFVIEIDFLCVTNFANILWNLSKLHKL